MSESLSESQIQSESLSDCLIENLGESDSLGESQNYRVRVSI